MQFMRPVNRQILAYIVNNPIGLFVPQQRNRVSSFVILVIPEVHVMKIFTSKELVYSRAFVLLFIGRKFPARPTLGIAFRVRADY